MGRFYKTASATPLDYMHKDNTALMERVISANDQFIDANMQGLAGLDQLANYNHLIGDEEDAKKITEGYQNRIESVVKAIQEDPANWRKQTNGIRELAKELQTDYKTGTISKHVYNYDQRKKAFDAVDKQVELYHTSGGTKGVDPRRAAAYKANWDSKFTKTGYNPSTGEYNVYKGGSVMDNIDVKKALADGLDKIKADKTNQYREDVYGNGWYFNKVTEQEERITPEKILSIASDNVNQDLLGYLRSDQEVGLIDGVYARDEKGNITEKLISPYNYVEVPLSSKEKEQIDGLKSAAAKEKNPAKKAVLEQALNEGLAYMKQRKQLQWDEQSYLAPILRGLVNTYSYSNITEGNDLSNNSYGSVHYTQQQTNARHGATLAQQDRHFKDRMAQAADHFNRNLDFEKYKWDNPHEKATSTRTGTGTGTKKKDDKKTEDKSIETGVSRIATRSFEDVTIVTSTGKTVPLISPAGLATAIDKTKKDISTAETRIKEIDAAVKANPNRLDRDALQAEKEILQTRTREANSELGQYRNWYTTAKNAALNNDPAAGDVNLKDEERELYKKYENDKEGKQYNKTMADIKAKIKALDPTNANHTVAYTELYKSLSDVTQEWERFQRINERVERGRDKVLETLRSDVIDNDAVQLGTEDGKTLGNIMFSNTQGYGIFDRTGKSAASRKIQEGNIPFFKDSYSMTFDNDELERYMKKYNVKPIVHKIGNTTKIGKGNAVAEVTFEGSDDIDPNERFYVEVTPEMQKELAKAVKANNKNPEVIRLASQWEDDEGNSIRRQMMQPSVNETVGGKDGEFVVDLPLRNGDTKPVRVMRYTEGNKNFLYVRDMDGNPLPSESGTGLGTFNGIEDFIVQYKKKMDKLFPTQ